MRIITAIDLETTGLPRDMSIADPNYPRMIQVGAVTWTDDNVTHGRILNYVRQEDKSTSISAERIHGISDWLSSSKGITEQVAIGWITNSLKYSSDVVGWNLQFDLDIVRAALIRYGKSPQDIISNHLSAHDLQDIMTPIVDKRFEDGGQRWPSLSEGYEFLFGKPLYEEDGKHDASRDSDACREIFMELLNRGLIDEQERKAA